MKKNLLKLAMLLLVAVMGGGNAVAETETVISLTFDDANNPTLSLDNANSNRGTANYDYKLNGDTFLNVWGENNSNGSKLVTLTTKDIATNDSEWTLEFDWAGYSGCNKKLGYTQIRDLSGKTILSFDDAADWGKTFTISSGGTLSCYPCNKSTRISAKTGSALTAEYWHHIKLVGNTTGIKLYVQDYNADGTLNTEYAINGVTISSANTTPGSIALRPGSCGSVAINNLTLSKETIKITTVNYTVKFMCDGKEIKDADTRSSVAGSTVSLNSTDKNTFWATDGTKYFYESDDASTTEIADDGSSVITVNFRKANEYSYTVTDNLNDTLATGKCTEGENVSGNYVQYKNVNGTLYEAKQGNAGYYKYSFIPTANDYNYNIDYTAKINNVAYFAEGEDIEGMTATGSANADIRCSNGKGGYSSDAVTATTLQPGKYKATIVVWGNAGATFSVKAGEKDILSTETKGYLYSEESEEFELTEATPITISGGDVNKMLDYIYITKTADVISLNSTYTYSTYCPESDLDFTGVEGVEAYTAKVNGSNVTLTKIEGKVKAGEGIIIKNVNNVESVSVPVTTDATALTDNDLKGVTADMTSTDFEGKTAYILVSDTEFQKVASTTAGILKKGKAYLLVSGDASAKPATLTIGGNATAISNVAEKADTQNAAIYNIQGMKVEKAVKGLYIVNGKKFVK